MKLTSRIATFVIIVVILAAAIAPAYAGGYLYAGKRRNINCGILYIPYATQPLGLTMTAGVVNAVTGTNTVRDFFSLLDNQTDLKPSGWSFDNPLSSKSGNSIYGKDDPFYWLVNISSVNNLSRMHVLYLPAEGTVILTSKDREKLRKFVDGGGVLWIDNSSDSNPLTFADNPSFDPGTFFIHGLYFVSGGPGGMGYPSDRHHPLLSSPFWLSPAEVGGLGGISGCNCVPGLGGNILTSTTPPVFFDSLLGIVDSALPGINPNPKPSVAANVYGSGRIVATANFVGWGCYARYMGSVYNALPNLKFAYNVISWAASSTTLRKDLRHSGSSIDTLGAAKLVQSWNMPNTPPSSDMENSPVIYKNIAFYTSRDTVYAVDVFPNEDLDQDGNIDDGEQDAGQNRGGEDIVWRWSEGSSGGQLSSPTVVTAPDPANPAQTIEAVLVVSSSGMVYMLDAFPNTSGRLSDSSPGVLWSDQTVKTQTSQSKLCPPIYVNGWVYVCGGDGRLYAFNPTLALYTGANEIPSRWNSPSDVAGASAGSATLRAGPSYCFTQDTKSGAVVGMVYWFVSRWNNPGQTTGTENDNIYGVPVYVGGERARIVSRSPNGRLLQCRINFSGGGMTPIGNPDDAGDRRKMVEIENVLSSNIKDVYPNSGLMGDQVTPNQYGSFVIEVNSGSSVPTNAVVHVTYAINYASHEGGPILYVNPHVKEQLEPKLTTGSSSSLAVPEAEITGTPAIGPDNMIYLNAKRNNNVSSVYAIKNDGTTTTTRWNYYLHSGLTSIINIAGSVTRDPDPAKNELPVPGVVVDSSGEPMQNPVPSSSPVFADGKVFVTVSAGQSADAGPKGALLCFKANPDFVIHIMESSGVDSNGKSIMQPKRLYDATGHKLSVKLWQPNAILQGMGGGLESPVPQPVISDWIDYDRGTITIEDFGRLKYSGAGGGASFRNTYTPSLPVWVFVADAVVPIDWSTWGPASLEGYASSNIRGDRVDLSQWNNLLWYYVVPDDQKIQSPPVVIGDKVYFTTDEGMLYAINTETGETQGKPVSNTNAAWSTRVTSTSLSANAGGSVASVSPTGSNGVLLVPAGDGLHAFTNTTTLVADNNRIVELDGGGDLAWSLDSVQWPSVIPSSPNSVIPKGSTPINKPARVRYVENGNLLIVNSGANQVCKVDKGGWTGFNPVTVSSGSSTGSTSTGYIRWTWDRFTDSKNMLRPGQPTELRSPTDAQFWMETETVGGKPLYVYHCAIADSGNHRIVDLVYRFDNGQLVGAKQDPATGFYLPDLNWVTKTDSTSERYIYDSIQLVRTTVGSDTRDGIWAAVSNYRTGLSDPGSPQKQGLGGAIVELLYRKFDNNQNPVYTDPKSGDIISCCDRVNWQSNPNSSIQGIQPLAAPRYFAVQDKIIAGNPMRYLLICDNYGVYKVELSSGGPTVVQALTDDMYRHAFRDIYQDNTGTRLDCPGIINPPSITTKIPGFGDDVVVQECGAPLLATSVQELGDGSWLIANNYSGFDKVDGFGLQFAPPRNSFGGEIFTVNFNGAAGSSIPGPYISWYAPSIIVPKNAGSPPYDPAVRKQRTSNGYAIQQPRCAFRQF